MTDRTNPDGETRRAERAEAGAEHAADRPPTPAEEDAAQTEVSDETGEAYQEMAERGAAAKGEGRIP
jgi:hypothetical protein